MFFLGNTSCLEPFVDELEKFVDCRPFPDELRKAFEYYNHSML